MSDLRTIEADSIRAFVQSAADEGYLSGRVLDYGCGRMPYREIVQNAGAEHFVFDSDEFPASVVAEGFVGKDWAWDAEDWDAILCTQVFQYVPNPPGLLNWFCRTLVNKHGFLVLTYPTNWPEVEPEDLRRFTKAGMERLLTEAGFTIIRHERRAELKNRDGIWALGYGVIARA